MAANPGTNVCLRKVEATRMVQLIKAHRVTHYCGAPIVHNLLVDALDTGDEHKQGLEHPVAAMVAGAPPPAAMMEGMGGSGVDLPPSYGLIETFGPATVAAKQDDWTELDVTER